jgi:hypothetical protein
MVMKRHMRDNYYVVGEGILTANAAGRPVCLRPSTVAALRKFRFSRLGPKGEQASAGLVERLAAAMTAGNPQPNSANRPIPSGFTYLAQFVDHDLTMDRTAVALGQDVTVNELVQGRSPALDLDSLYGRGPDNPDDRRFYGPDGVRLKVGSTSATTFPDNRVNRTIEGFDLPRVGSGSTLGEQRAAQIPDARNDENLAVAQTHLAFIRFHNRVVDDLAGAATSGRALFETARAQVVRHYQWMLRTDLLPRLVDPAIVDDVFTNGRRFFEVTAAEYSRWPQRHAQPGDTPTMPIEFSVAAYRLGHSMVRGGYQWNRVFNSNDGRGGIATLLLLFTFTGTNGTFTLSPNAADQDNPNFGTVTTLPTNWIADFRRLYDFGEAGRADLVVAATDGNVAQRIDTLMVNPLANLPLGSFGGRGTDPAVIQRNLAFRNLTRTNMVSLASGQQMADFLEVPQLKPEQILTGDGGASLAALTDEQRQELTSNTPLWFYILREAETNGGRLTGVGGRIVTEVFHRAMEGSRTSIVRDPAWRPTLGPDPDTFRMVDLLLYAFQGKAELLNPLGEN